MTKQLMIIIFTSALMIQYGCQEPSTERSYAEVDFTPTAIKVAAAETATPADVYTPLTETDEPAGAITLNEALVLAWEHNPGLASFAPQVLRAEAETWQASLRPNPDLEYEMEEFGGSGTVDGFDVAVNKLHVMQLIELADKRAKRERAAALGIDLVKWDYQSQRLDVTADVIKRYLDILAVQQRVALAEELVGISEKVLDTVGKRIEAGKDSPVEESKARVALANFRIELQLAESDLQAALRHLAATWGSEAVTFETVAGRLETVEAVSVAERELPLLEQLKQLLRQNPDLARWGTQIEQYQRLIELEKAKTVADPEVGAGVQHFNESGDVGLQIGLEVPLQIFDRNQAGVRASKHRLAQAYIEQRATQIKLDAALYEMYEILRSSQSVVQMLETDALPNVQKAFDAATLGYQEGKFDYLVVLDAQRTLFEARGQHIEALKRYHQAVADIERLIGGPLFKDN